MPNDDEFEDVLERLQAGDERAAAAVFYRFADRLTALARAHLNARLRQKVDPEDIVQSVYKSFFIRQARGQFALDNWESLWGLLMVVTVRKCRRCAERFRTDRRNMNAEVPMCISDESGAAAGDPAAQGDAPSAALLLAETLEELMLPLDVRERYILSLSLQGYSTMEISSEVGRTERTVQRVLQRVGKRLERMRGDEIGEP